MGRKYYVCRKCKKFTQERECPVCKIKDLSASWKGLVIINNPEGSEIAQALKINDKGTYALFVD
jgi:DNA-directed RNA polymerase subunit E"